MGMEQEVKLARPKSSKNVEYVHLIILWVKKVDLSEYSHNLPISSPDFMCSHLRVPWGRLRVLVFLSPCSS
jgi:hypothetical protein